jgi:hypothetical protein
MSPALRAYAGPQAGELKRDVMERIVCEKFSNAGAWDDLSLN